MFKLSKAADSSKPFWIEDKVRHDFECNKRTLAIKDSAGLIT
jgi:hypothetical protein